MKPTRGGARPSSGPKPRHGETKIDKNIALTPTVWAFLVSVGQSAGESIETRTRKSAAFKVWLKSREQQ